MAYKEFKGIESAKGQGFNANPQNINKKGQPHSFKKKFNELLSMDGVISIPAEDVEQYKDKEGNAFYQFKLPTFDSLMLKIMNIAHGKNEKEALNAIKFFWEQIDGKAKQSVEHSGEIVAPVAPTIIFKTKKK